MKRHNIKLATLAAAAVALIVPASANLVQNGNFSGTPSGPGYQTFTTGQTFATNWTVIDGITDPGAGSIDWISNYWVGPGGANSVDLDGDTAGGISQSITTVAGKTYTVSFDLSGNPDGGNPIKTLFVTAGLTTQDYTWNTAGAPGGPNTDSNMNWTPESFTFVAGTGTTTNLLFISGDAPSSFNGPAIANVDVEPLNITPEPGLYGALVVGFSGVFYALRRRKQA